jgi:alpha-tubulin suppressor-like RCC1 family protein
MLGVVSAVAWVVLLVTCGCGRIGFTDVDAAAADSADAPTSAMGWSKLVAYGNSTCGVFGGRAYCWGANDSGQLGDGGTANVPAPRAVMLPAGVVDDLNVGETNGCAIVAGRLYCFGDLGDPAPKEVVLGSAATAVSLGRVFRCVLAMKVQCWGANDEGELATGNMTPRTMPGPINFNGPTITAIDAGDDHACALDAAGDAHCWGHNDNGTMGAGSVNPTAQLVPNTVINKVHGLPNIGGWHACAITAGAVACWGQGTSGELGNGVQADQATPVPVIGLTAGVAAIATGGGPNDRDATCAIQNGAVRCWGGGAFGRLGNGATDDQLTPVDVIGLPLPAVEVAAGYGHACAVLTDGSAWCWGRGLAGELGDGTMANRLMPVRVLDP